MLSGCPHSLRSGVSLPFSLSCQFPSLCCCNLASLFCAVSPPQLPRYSPSFAVVPPLLFCSLSGMSRSISLCLLSQSCFSLLHCLCGMEGPLLLSSTSQAVFPAWLLHGGPSLALFYPTGSLPCFAVTGGEGSY